MPGDLSTTTHPLQCQGFELDMQETSPTEVCVSMFSFFLREKVGRETLKIGEESLSRQRIPNSAGVLDLSFKNKRHCCARVLGLLKGRWAGKGGQGNIQTREGLQESVRPWFSFTDGRGCASVCLGGLKSVSPCWSGRAQSCLIDWKGRAPVRRPRPKLLIDRKGPAPGRRARPKLPC